MSERGDGSNAWWGLPVIVSTLILLVVAKTVAELTLQRVDSARLATAGAVQ